MRIKKAIIKQEIKEWAIAIVIGTIAFVLLNATVGTHVVYGDSMFPTYESGDILLAIKKTNIKKGDIVVTDAKNPTSLPLVKRVVAVAGEIPDVEEYSSTEAIKDGYIYICGDNRDFSVDSRTFGAIKTTSVEGVVICKLF